MASDWKLATYFYHEKLIRTSKSSVGFSFNLSNPFMFSNFHPTPVICLNGQSWFKLSLGRTFPYSNFEYLELFFENLTPNLIFFYICSYEKKCSSRLIFFKNNNDPRRILSPFLRLGEKKRIIFFSWQQGREGHYWMAT